MPAKTVVVAPSDVTVDVTKEPRINWREYFAKQPQIAVFMKRDESDVIRDPDNQKTVLHEEGINGYKISLKMGHLNTVPLDFATQLITRKRAEPADHAAYEQALAARTTA